MNERDELAKLLYDEGAFCGVCSYESYVTCKDCRDVTMGYAKAILAAGYRKVEPIWEPTLRNDGVYEYTQTSTCDGSLVYNYRRLPRLKYEGEYRSWESYEPEAAK